MMKTLSFALVAVVLVAFTYFIVVGAIVYFTRPTSGFEVGPIQRVPAPTLIAP